MSWTAPITSSDVRDVRTAARAYLSRGAQPIPVAPRSKNPNLKGWPESRIGLEMVESTFAADSNIGILLGAPSGGLVDVDLDSTEARRVAASVLPPTGLVHGRPGSVRSHYWYRAAAAGSTQRFVDPVTGAVLVELRGNGCQTLVPPSVHPGGDPVLWHDGSQPGDVDFETLLADVKRLAGISLLACHWKNGSRHSTAMALSGFLLRRDVSIDRAEEIIRHVATAAQDEELDSRVQTVRDTAKKLEAKRPTTGVPTLSGFLDSKVIDKLEEWLGLGRSSSVVETVWDPPVPLGTIARTDFPTASLPCWMRAWVEAEAVATQTPPDLAGMLVIAVCASASAKKVCVRISESWTEPTNIYCVVVLAPGNRKSAVYADATRPLLEYEASELARLEPEIAQAESRHRVATERLREAEKSAAKPDAKKREADAIDLDELVKELGSSRVPARPRYVVDDCTPEQLATILQEQGGRIAIMAPEGDVFDLIAGRYSQKMPNLGVFLRGHNREDLRVDRVGRKSEFVKEAALTIALTVQPETLRSLAATPQFDGRGLTARFLYAIPESPMGRREVNPPPVPSEVRAAYHARVRTLLALEPPADGAPPYEITFDPDALRVFLDYQRWLEPQLAETGDLGFIANWAGKLMGEIARIAGILHMAAHVQHPAPWTVPLSPETVSCALVIGDYLTTHARIAFGEMGADRELDDARYLSRWLQDHRIGEITKREIFNRNRGRFRRARDLESPIEMLEECGYVRVRPEPEREGRGRPPSPTFLVNPRWLEAE